ncbi:MAG: hypothetical protein LBN12_05840, partial [Clostridiales Family XIII bacterium]|nr:hypothetical protein [Clostridiales Family XIII bacterium]
PAAFSDRLENGKHNVEVYFTDALATQSGRADIVVKRTAVTDPKDPKEPGQPEKTPPGEDPATGPSIAAPQTADDMDLTLWIVLMAAALAALIAAAVMRRRLMKGQQ